MFLFKGSLGLAEGRDTEIGHYDFNVKTGQGI